MWWVEYCKYLFQNYIPWLIYCAQDSAWVENVLYSVPGISEAALVGIPDERMDELAAALVTVRPEYKDTISEECLLAKAEEL